MKQNAASVKTCTHCKTEKPVADFYMVKSKARAPYLGACCKPCYKLKDMRPENRFSRVRADAVRRKMKWDISKPQFIALCGLPCEYCGSDTTSTGSSLDRLDPKLGYLLDNVVPSCWLCNFSRKGIYTPAEMRLLGPFVKGLSDARVAKGLPPIQPPLRGSAGGKYKHGWRDGVSWKE